MSTEGNIALVTGGGTGIGLAVARRLAKEGYSLLLVGRRQEPLRAAVVELGQSTRCVAHLADIGDMGQAAGCVDVAVGAFGRLDVVINNAGYAPLMPMESITHPEVERTFRVNAMGPAAIVGRVWATFLKQRRGCIVNISSYATVDPFPGLGVYAGAKAAVNLLAKSAHNEGHRSGIRAFAVAPGAVETAMLRSIVPVEALPASRTLSPEQVAAVVMECVLGRRDEQRGQVILVPSP